MSFTNKVVLVTGASSGIGAATAILFAKEGANVVMVGRNQAKLDAVAAKVASAGKKPLVLNADIAKDEEAKRIIKQTVDKFGKLDVLVNNAGFARNGSLIEGNFVQSYDMIMSVNVRGAINLTMLATPHLVKTKGNVINISSVAGLKISNPLFTPYSMSKAALDHFTRGAAKELSPSGVRVNSVNPGPVATDFIENANLDFKIEDIQAMTLLKRVSTSEEIADLIAYLAGDKAIGITGSVFVVDNGYLLR